MGHWAESCFSLFPFTKVSRGGGSPIHHRWDGQNPLPTRQDNMTDDFLSSSSALFQWKHFCASLPPPVWWGEEEEDSGPWVTSRKDNWYTAFPMGLFLLLLLPPSVKRFNHISEGQSIVNRRHSSQSRDFSSYSHWGEIPSSPLGGHPCCRDLNKKERNNHSLTCVQQKSRYNIWCRPGNQLRWAGRCCML